MDKIQRQIIIEKAKLVIKEHPEWQQMPFIDWTNQLERIQKGLRQDWSANSYVYFMREANSHWKHIQVRRRNKKDS